MPDGSTIPATAVADELLRLTSKVLSTLEHDEDTFEQELTAKRDALLQLVERDRDAVTRATERLNDLYRAARAIADNKGRRDVLEGILRQNVPLDPTRTFDELDTELGQELKLARGITGAMRVPDIGRLLNQAAVQVDHLEERADELETRLRDVTAAAADDSPARQAFADALANLRRDLDTFDAALPLPARPWDDAAWSAWEPPTAASSVLRFGAFTDPRLGESVVPALIDVPTDGGFVIEPARKRSQAVDAARAFVLRALAAFPPGRLRVSFIDPKARGESAAPFLHLAARDESVVDVVTGEHEIDTHLERVSAALSEPPGATSEVRLVVVFDHPVGLSTRSIALVQALAEAGGRGGVFTIVVKDSRTGSHPREARSIPSLRLVRATKQGFETEVADARRPLLLDEPPTADRFERIGALVASAPPPPIEPQDAPLDLRDETTWWDADTTDAVHVVLGRRERERDLSVTFDAGTTIAVVRGGGDPALSDALHATVLGLATRYAPAEIQLHLIGLGARRDVDGYAHHGLPHARLVGVQADRELALSALETATSEVARRLVLFQAAGVLREGYPAYRRETGHALARIVVVIDDADELLDGDDDVARRIDDALTELLADGASTGVHVLLVDRRGERLPTFLDRRASEGAVVVELADGERFEVAGPGERTGTLHALRARADGEGPVRSPKVVDGARAASFEHAPLDLLGAAGTNGGSPSTRLWLGEPVGLGSPVEVRLTPADATNVAIVVQDSDLGQGMMASAVTTAALAGSAAVRIVDLMPLEGAFAPVAAVLARRDDVAMSRRRELEATVESVRNQLVNRLARPDSHRTPWLFALNGLDRAAARQDDDGIAVLLRHLPQIVHDGPKVGIHTVLWGSDRSLEALIGADTWRAFGVRVVGPTDEASSLALMDSAMAASLAPNQAALYDEGEARVVRFRPYGLPRPEWTASLVHADQATPQTTAR